MAGSDVKQGYAKGRQTKQHILAAAVALFAEVGYRSASLREIAARCGISHPGLLHHFPSKEILLAAVLERRDALDSARYLPRSGTGRSQLQHLVALVEHNASVPELVELFATLSAEATDPNHPAHEWFVRRYAATRAHFTEVFQDAQRDGSLRAGVDPQAAATALVALMDGLQVEWLLDRGVDMAGVLREHLRALLREPL